MADHRADEVIVGQLLRLPFQIGRRPASARIRRGKRAHPRAVLQVFKRNFQANCFLIYSVLDVQRRS